MPFPLSPSPRRDASTAAATPSRTAMFGPDSVHSGADQSRQPQDAASRTDRPAASPTGAACGSRSTRPTGVR